MKIPLKEKESILICRTIDGVYILIKMEIILLIHFIKYGKDSELFNKLSNSILIPSITWIKELM